MWERVRGYEDLYKINEYGVIKSIHHTKDGIKSERILKPCVAGKGYLSACLCKNGVSTHKYIHRMVAECFVPNPYKLPVVNHIDGNKLNNFFENLEWVTYSDNNKHAYNSGLKDKGEKYYNAKLTEQQVHEIRRLGKYDTFQMIADKYGVSRATIRDVLLGKTW